MEFKCALSILFSNMGYAFKILLWILISLILTAAVGVAILYPIFDVIIKTTDLMSFINGIQQGIASFLDGALSIRQCAEVVVSDVSGAIGAITSNSGATVGLVFAIVFIYALYCFLVGLSYYPVADIVNKLMGSNLRFGFASNMALNLKNACKYSLCRLVVSLPIDIVFAVIIAAMVFGLVPLLKVFALPIVLIVFLVFCTLRAMLFAGWLPRMLHHPEERVFTNLTRSFTFVKSNMGGFFKAYMITFACVYLMGAVFTIPSGGLITIILPSLYYFLLRTVELIGYYKAKGYSFYTDASTVVNTVEFGYRSNNQQHMAVDSDGFDVERTSFHTGNDADADMLSVGEKGYEASENANLKSEENDGRVDV